MLPSLEFSASITSRASETVTKTSTGPEDEVSLLSEEEHIEKIFWAIVMNAITRHIYLEKTEGTSDEILLCLSKGIDWDTFEDYSSMVRQIRDMEGPMPDPAYGGPVSSWPSWNRLLIHAYFAMRDELCSPAGRAWFENCCSGEDFAFKADEMDADHNSILPLESGVMVSIFRAISRMPSNTNFLLREEYSDPLAKFLSRLDDPIPPVTVFQTHSNGASFNVRHRDTLAVPSLRNALSRIRPKCRAWFQSRS